MTKLSHNASLRFAGPETLIWQPCTLELNSNNGSVLINIKLRAERKILALCKHTDPEDYLKMLLYIFISKRANKSDKLVVWFHYISTCICYGRFYPHSTPSYHRAGWKDHSAHNQRKPTLFFWNTVVNGCRAWKPKYWDFFKIYKNDEKCFKCEFDWS